VVKLDRLARSVRHLTTLAGEFDAWGVDLIVLDQGIDTSTPAGRLLFNVLASIAEFERDLIIERTRAGIAAARRRGIHCGRPRSATTKEQRARALRMRGAGASLRYIAGVLGISAASVHRMLAVKE
jgi:DNA invertase Pin-like site-specific DNA recombinase